jgi:hypothetical protein
VLPSFRDEKWALLCSSVDIQITDRQNVDKMTEVVNKVTENVDFTRSHLTTPHKG